MSHDEEIRKITQEFHETYERLAPEFGYKTRGETAVPWSEVPMPNRALMYSTVEEVVGPILTRAEQAERELALLKPFIGEARENRARAEQAEAALAKRMTDDHQ